MINHLPQYCKRKARCRCGCGEIIPAGAVMVKTIIFNKEKKYTYQMCYFFDHWVKKQKHWFKENPYKAKAVGGRKKLDLVPEKARERKLLLMRYAKQKQMLTNYIKEIVSKGWNEKLAELIAKRQANMDEIKKLLEEYGGTPKNWH